MLGQLHKVLFLPSLSVSVTATLLLLLLSRPAAANPGVYYCTEPNWQGRCTWTDPTTFAHNCVDLNEALVPGVTTHFSFGPDHGLVCTLFGEFGCGQGDGIAGGFVFPGTPDVSTVQIVRDAGLNQIGARS